MMQRFIVRRIAGFALALLALLVCGVPAGQCADAQPKLQILCSTFPVWLLTRNITQGRDAVEVKLLIDAQMGCPHDYALTPQDMQKLAAAKLLVINGLGLEEFLGAPVKQANGKIVIVDASHDIPADKLLKYKVAHHGEKQADEHKEAHEAEEHVHAGMNPHLFASPRLYGQMGLAVAEKLSDADPAGAELYQKNAKDYAAKMDALGQEFAALGKILANNRIVTQHGVFDYLAADMGLEVAAVVAAHAEHEISAAEMLQIIKEIKEEKAGAVFTEPQYPAKVGQTIAREAGIKTATLDPVASGPDDAPLGYYETVMRANLQMLKNTLGTR